MPGFHTKKQKRQAKHIIAGYEKRGVSADRAKHIAWATVNKQKTEAWEFNGAGQPVFVGNYAGHISQFDPTGQTSPGQPYLPDEVAKMLVKESGLRKSDTVPKRVIVRYLESMGLSSGLAVDVAQVLRNVYGITPTFDEETLYGKSGNLVEELRHVLDESFPMPFIDLDDRQPEVLNEVEMIGTFIQDEFLESEDGDYDLVLGSLALISPDEFNGLVNFYEAVGPEMFDYFERLVAEGLDDVADQVLKGICFPSMIKFMPEEIQVLFEDAVDDVVKAGTARSRAMAAKRDLPKIPPLPKGGPKPVAHAQAPKAAKPGMSIPKIKKQSSVPSFKVQMRKHGQDMPGDKLASKKPGEALSKFREKKAQEKPAVALQKKPASGGVLKRIGKAAMSTIGKVHKSITTPSKANPDVGPALRKIASGAAKAGKAVAKGAAKGAGKAALGLLGGAAHAVGHVAGAGVSGVSRGLSHGQPKDRLGGIGHAIGRFVGKVKEGFKSATPGIQHQMNKGSESEAEPQGKKRVAKSAVGESLINELQGMLAEDSYPDLGQTPYGPAGDPKKGPLLAKDWMTPRPAGSMDVAKSTEPTRMFSDPDERDKARKAKLADVMSVLDTMRQNAAAAGVPPEGMFLNFYIDMQREKARYS